VAERNSLTIKCNMNENIFYNWLFHYNHHTNLWYAFHREDHSAYWNGTDTKYPILKSKEPKTLMEILKQTKGEADLIKNI